MADFATISDIEALWRPLSDSEKTRAEALIPIICDSLREEALRVGVDLDAEITARPTFASVAKSVTVDVVARTLQTSTSAEPMSQMSQTAGPYTVSGTFLNPGGGLFIKTSELRRLGIRRQLKRTVDLFGFDQGTDDNTLQQDTDGT